MCDINLVNSNALKGCVQGYGSYDMLTSSGIDPRELFDDMQNTEQLPHLIATEILIEECDDAAQEADQQNIEDDDMHLLPIMKTKAHAESRHSENNLDSSFNQILDGGSIYTTPSMFSLISMSENCARMNMVTSSYFITIYNNSLTIFTVFS